MRLQPLTGSRRAALLLAMAVVAFDQITKWWALRALTDGPMEVLGTFFRLALTRNSGAAFGLLPGAGSVLALLAIVIVVGIVGLLSEARGRLAVISMGLILGGAVGNLLDRLMRGSGFGNGKVVDFLDFKGWPTFNIADSAITVGVLLVLMEALRSTSKPPSPKS